MRSRGDHLVDVDGQNVLPNLRLWLDGRERILRTFDNQAQKDIMQLLLGHLAHWWIDNYLQLRFTGYARAKLGYHLTSGHIRRKRHYGAPQPLVWTGETQESVYDSVNVKTGGSAKKPWADVRMRLGGPRAEIVYEVLNTILDDELSGGGVAEIERLWVELVESSIATGRHQRGKQRGQIKRRALRGGTVTAIEVRESQAREGRLTLRKNDAADDRADLEIAHSEGKAKAQAALKRTRDRWHRQTGGAAAFARDPSRRADAGMSSTYRGSRRHRHAQAQARYRRRYATR